MIDYVSGKLAENAPTHVVIDVGGMGIHLNTSLSSFETARKVGDPVRLFAHLHVREDVLALYGFSTDAERTLFRLLIGVSGIGPPMAQKILSGISIGDFRQLVLAGDAKGLTGIKGIGQKIAQRLVLELKDRVMAVDADTTMPAGDAGSVEVAEEAVSALIGLGANPGQARRVVSEVIEEQDGDVSVEVVIKAALRSI